MTTRGIPRPMKFSCLEQFVFGSSAQFSHSNFPNVPKTTGIINKKQKSYYDLYNINNLELSRVNKNHLQILHRNIVLNQEDLHTSESFIKAQTGQNFMKQPKKQTITKKFMQTNMNMNSQQSNSKKIVPHTSQDFFIQQQKPSKQFNQNQLLFNYKKIAQQKKAKKKQFLQTMEAKLNRIQQQTKDLQNYHYEEQLQLKQIQKIHKQISKDLTQNTFTGNLNKKITQAVMNSQNQNLYGQFYQKEQNDRKVISIHQDMSPVEINHALNTHYTENQKLLEEIYKVKSRSKDKKINTKSDWNTSPSKTNAFQKTSKINAGVNKNLQMKNQSNQKKAFSTTTKVPPKSIKK